MPNPGSPLFVPVLTSERLILEPLSAAHGAGMFAMWSQAEVCRYSGAAFDLSGAPIRLPAEAQSDSDKIIDFLVEGAATGKRFRWALLTGSDRAFAGAAGSMRSGHAPNMRTISIPGFRGAG